MSTRRAIAPGSMADGGSLSRPAMTKLSTETKYRLLLELSREISRSLDLPDVLQHLVAYVRTAVDYDAAGIFVLNRRVLTTPGARENLIAGMAMVGFEPDPHREDPMLRSGKGIIGHVIKVGETVVAPDVSRNRRYVCGRPATRSEIAVPIISNAQVVGALNLESDRLDAYSAADAELLEFFATAAAIAIEKAMLHRQALENARLRHQLDIAREVQACLLPDNPPHVPGYDIAGVCLSSLEIGGDYFDYVPFSDGRLGLVVADVSGKGVPAALIMATFRAALRTEIQREHDILRMLGTVNRILGQSMEPSRFVTTVVGVLDPRDGSVSYVNCGHNPPMLLRADGTRTLLEHGVAALGMFRGAPPATATVALAPDDVLVLYTDGVVETWDSHDNEYGVARLEEAVRDSAGRDAKTVIDRIVASTQAFTGHTNYEDDFTVMVVRRLAA